VPRIDALKELVLEDPADPFPKYALAMELHQAERPDEALRWFERVVAEHPDYVPAYYQMGRALMQRGEEERAEAILVAGMVAARAAGDAHALAELQELRAENA